MSNITIISKNDFKKKLSQISSQNFNKVFLVYRLENKACTN